MLYVLQLPVLIVMMLLGLITCEESKRIHHLTYLSTAFVKLFREIARRRLRYIDIPKYFDWKIHKYTNYIHYDNYSVCVM